MNKRLFLLFLILISFSCNENFKEEQYPQYLSFKAPTNAEGVTPIHLPYQKGVVDYQLPVIVSGSLKNTWYYNVHVGLDPDTLSVFNYNRFLNRRELYYKLLPDKYYTFPDTLNISKGESIGLLNIEFLLENLNLEDNWILPLIIKDDPSFEYVSNQFRDYNNALLLIVPYNDYSGIYGATAYKEYLIGNEGETPLVKNEVKTYVVDDSTIFFYAGMIDETRTDRGRYKIFATFNERTQEVKLSANNPFMRFKANKVAHFTVEEINDATRPYLIHRFVEISNIDYNFTDYTSMKNGLLTYTVNGSLTMERQINSDIPDRDQAIIW